MMWKRLYNQNISINKYYENFLISLYNIKKFLKKSVKNFYEKNRELIKNRETS